MATYKVPQDVEAEDKLLGPLTFRQFIYAMVGTGLSFFSYLGFQAHWSIGIVPIPAVIIFFILAFYKREDQPVEAFVVAFLRYYFLPRRRIWNRKGHNTYVKITAPKRKAEPHYRSASEAKSQLKTLAQIVDTRGWSSKQSELQLPNNQEAIPLDDRLMVPDFRANRDPVEVHSSDDVFEDGNKTANVFSQLSKSAQVSTRQEAISKMQKAIKESQDHPKEQVDQGGDQENTAAETRKEEPKFNPYPEGFHPKKVVQPMHHSPNQSSSGMTEEERADILELSQNDGLSLEELAKHAHRMSGKDIESESQENTQ